MNKNNNKILIFILLLLLGSILLAFYIEYILGHKPCRLCIYQRYPYYVSILLILNILVINKYPKKTLFGLSIISFIGASIAFYHFGIEQGFINESLVCETQKLGVNPEVKKIISFDKIKTESLLISDILNEEKFEKKNKQKFKKKYTGMYNLYLRNLRKPKRSSFKSWGHSSKL